MAVAAILMVAVSLVALCTGPVAVPPSQVLGTLLAHVPLLHFHTQHPCHRPGRGVAAAGAAGGVGRHRRSDAGRRRRRLSGRLPQSPGRSLPPRRGRRSGPRGHHRHRLRRGLLDAAAHLRLRGWLAGRRRHVPHRCGRWAPGLGPFHRAGRGGRGSAAHRHPDLPPATGPGTDPADLQLDPRQLLGGIVVGREAHPPLCRGQRGGPARSPPHARRAAGGGRGGGHARHPRRPAPG